MYQWGVAGSPGTRTLTLVESFLSRLLRCRKQPPVKLRAQVLDTRTKARLVVGCQVLQSDVKLQLEATGQMEDKRTFLRRDTARASVPCDPREVIETGPPV